MTSSEKLVVDLETRVDVTSQMSGVLGLQLPNAAAMRKLYDESLERLGLAHTPESWIMFLTGYGDGLSIGGRITKDVQAQAASQARYHRAPAGRHIGNLWGLLP